MQVLLLDGDPRRQADIARVLSGQGMQVSCMESLSAAECFVRALPVEVLVLGERIGGRLSHSLALLAECRNPRVRAVLLTDRAAEAVDELFELIPAVQAILGCTVPPEVVGQVVAATLEAGQKVMSDAEATAFPAEELLIGMAGQMAAPPVVAATGAAAGRMAAEPVLSGGVAPDSMAPDSIAPDSMAADHRLARTARDDAPVADVAIREPVDPLPPARTASGLPLVTAPVASATGTVVPAAMAAPDVASFTDWLDWLDTRATDEVVQRHPGAYIAAKAAAPDLDPSALPQPVPAQDSAPVSDPGPAGSTACAPTPVPASAEAADLPELAKPQHFSIFWQRDSWLRGADVTSATAEPAPMPAPMPAPLPAPVAAQMTGPLATSPATSAADLAASDLAAFSVPLRRPLTGPARRLHLA
ncbi:MAG: hypothetical protein JJT81_02525 [Rubellimicrobium sp.]|nr:hypothetical protein [Rubellimicrobium sp.]